MEMGSWECIMSKVTDVTWDEDRETKGTSQGKEEAQYNKLGKNGREVAKNPEKPGWRRWGVTERLEYTGVHDKC